MSTSASAILDGLVTSLQAVTAFGTANVSKGDYGVLDTCSTDFAVVVRWASVDLEPEAFDDSDGDSNDTEAHTYIVDGFIKFRDNEATYNANVVTFVDQLKTRLQADRTLGSTCDNAMLRRAEEVTRDFDVDYNGQRYKLVRATVETTKYAD